MVENMTKIVIKPFQILIVLMFAIMSNIFIVSDIEIDEAIDDRLPIEYHYKPTYKSY